MRASSLYELMRKVFPPEISLKGAWKQGTYMIAPELNKAWNKVETRMHKKYGEDSIESLSVWVFFGLIHRQAKKQIGKAQAIKGECISLASFKRELERCLKVDGWKSLYEEYKQANLEIGRKV